MPTRRPMWRDWANSWRRGATYQEMEKFVAAVGERVIQQAKCDARRWRQLFENLARIPEAAHPQLLAGTEQLARSELSDDDRRMLADELSKQLQRHRDFQHTDWALPPETLDALEAHVGLLKPRSLAHRHAWLFDQRPDQFTRCRSNSYAENERALQETRCEAVREITWST